MDMGQDDLILVIGRMERAISRLENSLAGASVPKQEHSLFADYDRLRKAAEDAIARIDMITNAGDKQNG
jgi:hypothetical protein